MAVNSASRVVPKRLPTHLASVHRRKTKHNCPPTHLACVHHQVVLNLDAAVAQHLVHAQQTHQAEGEQRDCSGEKENSDGGHKLRPVIVIHSSTKRQMDKVPGS